ncbi:MAG: hypothetical protein PHW36_00735 [Bacilli bacterium]|nr:hypothetical protein [Bacilli bacterium]
MTKQFELKFTEENLQRHLSYDPIVIKTIRDNIKAEIGDVTIINSKIYNVASITPITMDELQHPENYLWKQEGFSSQHEYIEEIQRIYGNDPDKELFLYLLHQLIRVKQIHNPVTDKIYSIRDRSSKPPKSGIKGLWEVPE